MHIVEEIFRRADRNHPALLHCGRTLTFGDLEASVNEAMKAMKDDAHWPHWPRAAHPRIGLSCPNGFDHVILSLAILRAGGVLVPIAPELATPEKQEVADTTCLHAIVSTQGQNWNGLESARSSTAVDGVAFAVSVDVTGGARAKGVERNSAFPEDALNAVDPALIRFSSGTTGQSKGVVLSHMTLFSRVTACNRHLDIGPDDRVIWILPMAHHFAVSIILYLLHGATTVIADSHLAEDICSELERSRGTVLYASPFHYAMLAGYDAGKPMPELRLAVSTASALPETIAQNFQARYGLPLSQGFGIIEAGLPILNCDAAATKPTSIGRPQPDFEVRLDSPDDRGAGELLLRGPGLFDAYLTPWQLRGDVLRDGWFATGDLATIDEDGDISLCGRLKSVINVAGLKCFPEEIEAILVQHPAIAEARVTAMPHREMGSVPAAEIVPVDPENPPKPVAISKFCKDYLAKYKIPMRYQVVDAIERTASGKIKR